MVDSNFEAVLEVLKTDNRIWTPTYRWMEPSVLLIEFWARNVFSKQTLLNIFKMILNLYLLSI
jgi:hypothetical protein